MAPQGGSGALNFRPRRSGLYHQLPTSLEAQATQFLTDRATTAYSKTCTEAT
jgi:hypothetical protein